MKTILRILVPAILVVSFLTVSSLSQTNSESAAAPIEFEKGGATESGELAAGAESAFIFHGLKGQRIAVRNPQTKLFKFRLKTKDFEMESDFDGNLEYRLDLPSDGDYLFYVNSPTD